MWGHLAAVGLLPGHPPNHQTHASASAFSPGCCPREGSLTHLDRSVKGSYGRGGEAEPLLSADFPTVSTMLSDASTLAYFVLEVTIAALAVLGNALVCWAVRINSNLQSVTNFFVVSLAAADIAVGVLAVPFAIAISTGFCAHFYSCLFIACFVLVLTQSSIFSLLAIAIDRYIAIKMPLRYSTLVTCKRAKEIIAVCWVLSVVIGLTPMLGWHKCSSATNSSCPTGTVACLFEGVVTMDYMVYFNFFAFVLVPLLLMLAIYLCIFMAARRQLKWMELKRPNPLGEKPYSTLLKEVHAAKSLAIIVGLFAICWLPLHVINCFTLFCPGCARPHPSIVYLAIVLSHANSVVNPLIYAYRIREFRHTFHRIIRRHLLGCRSARMTSSNRASWRTSTKASMTEGGGANSGDGSAGATTGANGFLLNSGSNCGSTDLGGSFLDLGYWKPPGLFPSSCLVEAPQGSQLRQLPGEAKQPPWRGDQHTSCVTDIEETFSAPIKPTFGR
nr:adenosine receptor A2a-like isoform X1 [Paramormyrops kingsleyae]